MKNSIMKFLIFDKQIRIYILNGNQILNKVNNSNTLASFKIDLKKALNVTALMASLNNENQRFTLRFTSSDNQNFISTEGFSSKTIAGYSNIKSESNFKNGNLQVIRSTEIMYGNSYTSFTSLDTGDFYADISSFYTQSEQVQTAIIPINAIDRKSNTLILVQALPFSNENIFEKTIQNLSALESHFNFSNIEKSKNELSKLFPKVKFLEKIYIPYSCACSKEMFIGIIFSFGIDEINSIISNNKTLTTHCSMCGKEYKFTASEIKNYLL